MNANNAPFALSPELRTFLFCILAICAADLILSIRRMLRQPVTMQTLFEPALLVLINDLRFRAHVARSVRRPNEER